MITIKKISLNLEPNEKWAKSVIENLNFDYTETGLKKKITGVLTSKYSRSDKNIHSKRNSLSVIINLNKKEFGKLYNIKITGCLKSWYFGNTYTQFTKFTFNDCINKLSQRLFIKKNKLLKAKVTSVSFGTHLTFKSYEQELFNWIFDFNDSTLKSLDINSDLRFSTGDTIFSIMKPITSSECIRFIVDVNDITKVPFLKENIQCIQDINIKWNFLVAFLEREIYLKFNQKSKDFLSTFRDKISEQIGTLKCVLTFEEENENFMKNLASNWVIGAYVIEKSYHEVSNCLQEYESALKNVKTEKGINRLTQKIEKLKLIIAEANKRTEIEEENDRMEHEYLQKAMYGSDSN